MSEQKQSKNPTVKVQTEKDKFSNNDDVYVTVSDGNDVCTSGEKSLEDAIRTNDKIQLNKDNNDIVVKDDNSNIGVGKTLENALVEYVRVKDNISREDAILSILKGFVDDVKQTKDDEIEVSIDTVKLYGDDMKDAIVNYYNENHI